MDSNHYLFTDLAKADLNKIISYIALELHNLPAANTFYNNVIEALNILVSFPESGSEVENEFLFGDNIRKMSIQNYIMYYFYNKDKKEIIILRIVYGKMNLDEILKTI